jgi:hypothetical protein
VFLNIRNPLRVKDAGGWTWHNLESVLMGKVAPDTIRMIRGYDDRAAEIEQEYLYRHQTADQDLYAYEKSPEYLELLDDFGNAIRAALKSEGYDGLVYENTGETMGGQEMAEKVANAYIAIEDKFGPWHGQRPDIVESPEGRTYYKALDEQRRHLKENREDSFITFDPPQIKSIFNRGTFDPGNADILKSVAADVAGDLQALIDKPKGESGKVVVAPVSEAEVARLNRLGIDVDASYTHVVDKSGINHALKTHGTAEREEPRGQEPVTAEDILRIPEILASPDSVEPAGKSRIGLPLIRYSKRFNGDTYYVEEVRGGRKELALQTMYKRKARGGQMANPSTRTSETTPDDDSLPQLKSVASFSEGPVFYSQAEKTIEEKMPARASDLQVRQILSPKNGIKQEELEWLGIDQWLKDHPKPSKDEVLSFIRDNNVQLQEVLKGKLRDGESPDIEAIKKSLGAGKSYRINDGSYLTQEKDGRILVNDEWADDGTYFDNVEQALEYVNDRGPISSDGPPKFKQYTLPGGDNYREMLLTLPRRELSWSEFKSLDVHEGKAEDQIRSLFDNAVNAGLKLYKPEDPYYKSSHWDEANPVAHIRFDDRDGGRTLHVAEIQSDWHQTGRDRGYRTVSPENLRVRGEATETSTGKAYWIERADTGALVGLFPAESVEAAIKDAVKHVKNSTVGTDVPDAPFKKSWHELALKRALRYAAEHGYDRLTWDVGDTVSERFNLSHHLKSIEWKSGTNGVTRVSLKTVNGNNVAFTVDANGVISRDTSLAIPEIPEELVGKHISDVIGKAPGEKILKEESGELSGEGLKIGGAGMRGFYDKILPAFANKYVKKWGARVEPYTLHSPTERESSLEVVFADEVGQGIYDEYYDSDLKPIAAEKAKELAEKGERVWGGVGRNLAPVHSIEITPEMRSSVLRGQQLFKLRDPESQVLLQRVLPKAELQDVVEGVSGGTFNDENDLELTEHDAELLRRMLQLVDGRKHKAFDAITLFGNTLPVLSRRLSGLAGQLKNADYPEPMVENVRTLAFHLDKLDALNRGVGVMYVFEDARHEEKFHQEDVRADRTDAQAVREISAMPLNDASPLFDRQYGDVSGLNRISELVAKLATGQEKAYGWDKVRDFEGERARVYDAFIDGVIRNNADKIREVGLDTFFDRFPRLKKVYEEAQSHKNTAAEGTGSPRPGDQPGEGPLETPLRTGSTDALGTGETGRATDSDADTATGDQSGERSRDQERSDGRALQEKEIADEKAEADARGTSPQEIRALNRKFARTLRENGRDAIDVPYIPGTDIERSREVEQILNESERQADESVEPVSDFAHALDVFEDPNTDGRTRTTLGIALIDRLGAAGEYTQMYRVAQMTTAHVGEAAQALQAASLVSKYDFANGVQLAVRAFEKQGKQLTDRDIDDIKEGTRAYAEAEETRAIHDYALQELEERIKQLETENLELGDALGEQREAIGEKNKFIESLKRQLERFKNGGLKPATAEGGITRGVSKTHQELLDRRGAILQRLRDKFPQAASALKAVAGDGANIGSADFDDETRKALVEYAALEIFDNKSVRRRH